MVVHVQHLRWIHKISKYFLFKVIETMEDLVQFVKDLSPCLSKVNILNSLSNTLNVSGLFL